MTRGPVRRDGDHRSRRPACVPVRARMNRRQRAPAETGRPQVGDVPRNLSPKGGRPPRRGASAAVIKNHNARDYKQPECGPATAGSDEHRHYRQHGHEDHDRGPAPEDPQGKPHRLGSPAPVPRVGVCQSDAHNAEVIDRYRDGKQTGRRSQYSPEQSHGPPSPRVR